MNAAYSQLIATLEQGWEIIPPVYLRPRWTSDVGNVYHFIISKQGEDLTQIITINDDALAQNFIAAHQLKVAK
jgi:hypothetical protein